ncbi:MAG: hypothetical protein JXA90_03850, partial [Planctomycetes bacterium]|nr:hypothetical protein [Planctomycetota bacterium]
MQTTIRFSVGRGLPSALLVWLGLALRSIHAGGTPHLAALAAPATAEAPAAGAAPPEAAGPTGAPVTDVDFPRPDRLAARECRSLERGPLEVRARLCRGAPCAIDIGWGQAAPHAAARCTINGRSAVVRGGAFTGFDAITFDAPGLWIDRETTVLRIEPLIASAAPAPSPAPAIAWIRIRRLSGLAKPASGAAALRIEAEDLEGSWNEQTNIPGYSGRGFRVSNARGVAQSVLRGDVDVSRAGRHAVWARGYLGDGQDRSFSLAVGEEDLPPTHRDRALQQYRWQLAGYADLAEGRHRLVVRDAGDGFEVVDALLVTSDLELDPGLRDRLEERLFASGEDGEKRDEVALLIDRTSARAEAADLEFRRRALDPAADPDRVRREQDRLRARLRDALGLEPLPPRTPLRARTIGIARRDGYSIERVVFESRPGFPVTANVYVPEPEAETEAEREADAEAETETQSETEAAAGCGGR